MLRRRKKWKFWILGISALLLASDAPADTFSFVQGELGATANFELLSGGLLRVTLTNTGGDVLIPSQILTGVFFDLAEAGPLTPVSATLAHGSRVRFGPDGGGNLGGEWAYRSGLFDAPGGAGGGISTVCQRRLKFPHSAGRKFPTPGEVVVDGSGRPVQHGGRPVKRRRALVETNPPRNSRLETHRGR